MAGSVLGAQCAALPWRQGQDGTEVMLVTSREQGRWVAPKGWLAPGEDPAQGAAREALEEAGVSGPIAVVAVGAYYYVKRLKDRSLLCRVEVFPLRVDAQADHWPEEAERRRRWFSLDEAAAAVDEPDLKRLIAAFRP